MSGGGLLTFYHLDFTRWLQRLQTGSIGLCLSKFREQRDLFLGIPVQFSLSEDDLDDTRVSRCIADPIHKLVSQSTMCTCFANVIASVLQQISPEYKNYPFGKAALGGGK